MAAKKGQGKQQQILLSTTEEMPQKKIKEVLGIAKGSTIRAKHIGKDILASLKQLIGGELTEYTKMMNEARDEAIARMVMDAQRLGADAIVCVRFNSADVAQGAAEVMAYGTAVKLKK